MSLRMTVKVLKESTVEGLVKSVQDAIDNGHQMHGTPFWGIEKGNEGFFCQMVTVMINTKAN